MRTRRRLLIGGVLVTALATAAMLIAPETIENRIAPRATIVSEYDVGTPTLEEQVYLQGMSPYLDVLIGEGRVLQRLGNARSRNIIELSLRMERYRTAAADISQYITDTPTPPRLAQYVTELQNEVEASLRAIDESIHAFRRLDWDALGQSVGAFSATIDAIVNLSGTPVAN